MALACPPATATAAVGPSAPWGHRRTLHAESPTVSHCGADWAHPPRGLRKIFRKRNRSLTNWARNVVGHEAQRNRLAAPEAVDHEPTHCRHRDPRQRLPADCGTIPALICWPPAVNTRAIDWACRVRGVSPTQHHVLLVLAGHANDDGAECRLSIRSMAEITGLGERAVQMAVAALERARFVIADRPPGRPARFTLRLHRTTPAGSSPDPGTGCARAADAPPHGLRPAPDAPPHVVREPPHGLRSTPAAHAPGSSSNESSRSELLTYKSLPSPCARDEADAVVAAFDESLAACSHTRRPHPHPHDRETALRWLRTGAERGVGAAEMAALAIATMSGVHRRLRHPPAGLRFHDDDVARALAIRSTPLPVPEVNNHARHLHRRSDATPERPFRRSHGTDPDASKRAVLRGLAGELEGVEYAARGDARTSGGGHSCP